MHVHVQGPEGEAKFWLEPSLELAGNWGLSRRTLRKAAGLIREHENAFREAWEEHFGG